VHPVLIDLGELRLFGVDVPLVVGSYGAAMLAAIVFGWWFTRREGRRVAPGVGWSEIFGGTVVAGLVGAKLLHAIVLLPRIAADPVQLAGVARGGGVWLGGIVAGSVWLAVAARRRGVPAGTAFDLFFAGVPLAHAIGRAGCLLAGCCYGAACSLPWAVTFSNPLAARFNGTPLGVPLHPVPAYEMFLELVNFCICFGIWRRRAPAWTVFATWSLLYGVERFLLEYLRGDPRGSLGPLSTSQWISLALAGGGCALLVSAAIRRRSGDARPGPRGGEPGSPPGPESAPRARPTPRGA
jgi:phosphatidylglycerol:prolipoprotein diacylglycerol transferase